jgi:hypothetical protein
MNREDLTQQAREAGYQFKIVYPGDPGYDDARRIANSRFDLFPGAIVFCATANDVAWCVNFCRRGGIHLRVRSGGHHHEGMCSADGVLVIDLSNFNKIDYQGLDQAWIPPGKHLREVYAELEGRHRMIPGGGCESVCVGGLTQGGGWGPSARKLGLTCDNILAAEIVLADGRIVTATAGNEFADLFWAIRGGGGGNFGIVTNFLFRLEQLDGWLTTFEVHWTKPQMLAVCTKWMQEFSGLNPNLTTFCRLTVVDQETSDTPAVLVAGQFYGAIADLQEILKPLCAVAEPCFSKYEAIDYTDPPSVAATNAGGGRAATPQTDAYLALGALMQPGPPNAPSQTCDMPHPHKISSTFPQSHDHRQLARTLVDFIQSSTASPTVNLYLSLHGMGGAIRKVSARGSAFPYRDKDFMLQFQAWWTDPRDPRSGENLRWIESFRRRMIPFTEGSFINFPDKFLVQDSDRQRLELLEFYYGLNLPDLRKIKAKYDPENRFDFGMGIPPNGYDSL